MDNENLAGDDDLLPGQCPGCRADYPHCDCAYYDDEEGAAESREGQYTAWEIIG